MSIQFLDRLGCLHITFDRVVEYVVPSSAKIPYIVTFDRVIGKEIIKYIPYSDY